MKRRKRRLIEEEKHWAQKVQSLDPKKSRRKYRQVQARYIESWRKLKAER